MSAKVNKGKCNGCGTCVDVCPTNAIVIEDKLAIICDDCVDCGACLSVCPTEALSL